MMIEKTVKIHTEYIKLGDLLKFSSVVSSGSDAKHLILEGKVRINGETVLQRGKKIFAGMVVECDYNELYKITIEQE